uniref:Asialoglycoprotein receptor 1-like n=1 Tax=Fundulus heteroclitus TaxID=8078 RepID=A0A3Q2PN46_FUNHE
MKYSLQIDTIINVKKAVIKSCIYFLFGLRSTVVLLPDKKEEGTIQWFQQLAWCFGTLFFSLLLVVIAVSFTVSESRIANLTAEKQNLTTQNQKLESEKRNLTERIHNLETRWNEQNISRAQWSIDAYCPNNNTNRTCQRCQDGWVSYQSSCYSVNNAQSTSRINWQEAQEDCRRSNSDLVVVLDESEKSFVSEYSWGSSGNQGYWIGLKAEDGKWKWVNGSELINKNWIQTNANDGQCVISVTQDGWKSVQCKEAQQWICEKKALSI